MAEKKTEATQMSPTEVEAKKVPISQLQKELWDSGTPIFAGVINEEYKAELQGTTGMRTYDEMRRSDSTISALLLACTLPLRSTEWDVKPAENYEWDAEEIDREIAEFVKKALFIEMEQWWDHFLQEVMTFFAFWFSLFEKVYTIKDNKVYIKKLAFRKQRTIEQRQTSTGEPGVLQQLDSIKMSGENKGMGNIDIPAAKLLRFTINQEGDNYEGISILRAAYKSWFIKSNLEKFDAVRHEKWSIWVPVIYIPSTASEQDKEEVKKILKNFKTNQQTGIVIPWSKEDGREFTFADLNKGGDTKLLESIKYHDRNIVKTVLAQWIELGATESWSRSLGESQGNIFLNAMEAFGKVITDTINRFLIPELVDLNFNDVQRYPELSFTKIGDNQILAMTDAIIWYVNAWVLTLDDELERFMRENLQLPPRDLESSKDAEGNMIPEESQEEVELDADWNPIEYEPVEDEDMDISDMEDESDLDEMEAELDKLEAGDPDVYMHKFSEYCDRLEYFADDSFDNSAEFRALEQKQKDAISEWLKRYWAGQGKSPQDVKSGAQKTSTEMTKIADTLKAKISTEREKMKRLREWVKSMVQSLRDKIPKTTKGMSKSQRAAIKAEATKIRAKIKEARELSKSTLSTMKSEIDKYRTAANIAKTSASTAKKTIKEIDKQEKKKNKKVKANELPDWDCGNCLHDPYFSELCAVVDNSMILDLQKQLYTEDGSLAKKKWLKFNDYEKKSPRPMTFAERKVNFAWLQRLFDQYESQLDSTLSVLFAKQKKDLVEQIAEAVRTNDVATIGKIKAKFTDEMAQELTNIQKEVFEAGKKAAAAEMAVKVPGTSAEVRGVMRVQNNALVAKVASDMEKTAQLTATQIIAKNAWSITETGIGKVKVGVSEAIDTFTTKVKNSFNTLTVTGALNLGRATIFERYPEKVYAFQYSAILDERTTDRCLSLDGRVVKAGSPAFIDYSPPQHYNCRSIWVGILTDEVFKPSITGIPSTIDPVLSIDNASKVTKPVSILKNSPAIAQIRNEIAEREAKLEELKKTGQFPNRQKDHENRIKQLKNSIKGKFKEHIKSELKKNWLRFTDS